MAREAVKPRFVLPESITGPVEVGRLLREIDGINEFMLQSSLKHGGKSVAAPKTSQLLADTLEANDLNLELKKDRQRLSKSLQLIKVKAPLVHMSFAADPTADFTAKIVAWLRREISPYVLLTVGLQPTIGAGCILRTTNKYFDLSLKQGFANKREMLTESIAKVTESAA